MIFDLLAAGLVLVGGAFVLLAGVGVLRMPDLFTRMQAATKGATLGAGCLLLAVAVHYRNLDVSARAVLVIAFVFLTAPIAAHLIARAAYAVGVPLWAGTVRDELRDARPTSTDAVEPPGSPEPRFRLPDGPGDTSDQ
jgi:multicomponent Na+:H+ antiporter subunit G